MDAHDEGRLGGIYVDGWGPEPHRGVNAALLLVSTGLLTLEISLTRFFSFTVWYHLAYLTISVALLGFGSSGAIIASYPDLFRRRGQGLVVACLEAAAVLTVVGLFVLAQFPLDVGSLITHPVFFFASLLGYYLVIGSPFLLAGFAVSLPFAVYPRRMGRLYFWDLFGAALGCALVVRLIEPFGVPGLIIGAGGLLLAGASALDLGAGKRRNGTLLLGAAVVVITLAPAIGRRIPISVTGTKALGTPQWIARLKGPDRFSKWTALERVDAAGWLHPVRGGYWRGLGIAHDYSGPVPEVADIQYDGSNGSNIYSFKGSFDNLAMLDHHVLRDPYVILDKPSVLVIGVGGGVDMMNAIKQGAHHVTGVELQPETVKLLTGRLRDFTGGFYSRPDVTLQAGEGRHFVRKSHDTFDLIQLTAVDTFAAQASGAYVMAESYLYTVEADEDYLARLNADGLLSMIIGDMVFPGTIPPLVTRLALNGYRALEHQGVVNPEQHLMVISVKNRSGLTQCGNVLVKKSPFTREEVRALEAYATQNGFEVMYAPAIYSPRAHRLSEVLGKDESVRQWQLAESWFRIDPTSDKNPFLFNVGKWSHLSPNKSLPMVHPGSFVGQLVLVLMIVQSVLLGMVLIVYPLSRGAREGLRVPGVLSYLVYFLALGVGFMFIEMSFVQSFVLFLGSPTYALSVTIFSLLLFSSVGSFLSSGFVDRPEWVLRRLVPAVALLVVGYTLGLNKVFNAFLHLELLPRILIAVAAQVPMGLMLGMFMPLGIACVSREHPRLVPWAWGINGLGSVVGTTLAVVLAMLWGFTVVACSAAVLYLVGTALMVGTRAGVPVVRVGAEPGAAAGS
jgi:hypothetical protein